MIRATALMLSLIFAAAPVSARLAVGQDQAVLSPALSFAAQEQEEREPGPADLEEAIEIAVKRYGGQATRSETVVIDGRSVHEIRLYNEEEGTVRTVRIDPETGAIIPPRR